MNTASDSLAIKRRTWLALIALIFTVTCLPAAADWYVSPQSTAASARNDARRPAATRDDDNPIDMLSRAAERFEALVYSRP